MSALAMTKSGDPAVFSFVDLSNVWYGIRDAATEHHEEPKATRLSAENLAVLLRAGRSRFTQLAVANADVPLPVINRFPQVGRVIRRESGRMTQTEQANDETVQVRLYEALHQHPPGVVVLATGDGNGWREGRGFLPALDAARKHKWGIELIAWRATANSHLVASVQKMGGVFVPLDDYYFSITFEEGGRRVQGVNLRHRPTAEPVGWVAAR